MLAARSSTYDSSARGPDPGAAPSRRRRGIRAGLAAGLALMVMAVAAPAASAQQPGAWACDSFGYLFQNYSTFDNAIVQVDLATGTQTPVARPALPLNAAGYNQLDGYYYAFEQTDAVTNTWTIVRVHSDGSVDDLGNPLPVTTGSAIGEVDPNGHYWIIATNTLGDATWYEIDLVPGSPTYGQVIDSGPVTFPTGLVNVGADWTWINGGLYSVGTDAAGVHQLVRFDPTTGVFSNLGNLPAPFPTGGDGNIGAVFADASGYLYASANSTNTVWRIDTNTRQVIMSAPPPPGVPSSPGNDGARCGAAVVPTITVTKTVNGRVRPADQFTVGLRRPDASLADSATTSGSGTTASTVNVPASQGKTYTITDEMAAGSPTPIGEYAKSIRCTDADGNVVPTGGSGPTWTLDVAQPTFYTCNVTNQAVADLKLEKTAAPSPVVPGEDVTWTMTVTNNGPSTSIGETVTDDLPDEVTFSAASAGCSEASGVVSCAVGELAPGASKSFTITAGVASSLDKCLRNTGTVSGQFDPDTSNNTATICTPITGRSNVSITKAASSDKVASGGQVMYTLVIRNNGPSDDPGVQVSDPLPAGLALVLAQPSQGTCTTTSNTVSCDMGRLKDGGSAQVLVTATVTATSGCINNTARVQGAHEDPNPDNNSASAQVCVDPPPPANFDLEVDKRANHNRVVVGQSLRYTIVVRNNGPDAAPDAKVTDTLNNRATVVSVSTTAGSCTKKIPITCELGPIAAGESVTVTVVIKPRESGRLRNAASATSCCGTDNTPDNNLDKVDVTVRKVALKISKVASSSSVQAGGTVNYRIRVRNPTKGEARNAKVCDRPQSGMRFVSSSPKAKRSRGQRCWTIKSLKARKSRTFRVTMRMADGANGRKVNRATVNGAQAKAATARRPVRVRGVATPVTG